MAMHTIDRVREAETNAMQARLKAEAQARDVLDSANAEVERILAGAKAEMEKERFDALKKAKQLSDELISARREKAQAEADALRDKTMRLRQNIINQLIEETLV